MGIDEFSVLLRLTSVKADSKAGKGAALELVDGEKRVDAARALDVAPPTIAKAVKSILQAKNTAEEYAKLMGYDLKKPVMA